MLVVDDVVLTLLLWFITELFICAGTEAEDCVPVVLCQLSGGGVHQPSVCRLPPTTRPVPRGEPPQNRTLDRLLLSLESPHEASGIIPFTTYSKSWSLAILKSLI